MVCIQADALLDVKSDSVGATAKERLIGQTMSCHAQAYPCIRERRDVAIEVLQAIAFVCARGNRLESKPVRSADAPGLAQNPSASSPDVSGLGKQLVMPASSHCRISSPLKQPRSVTMAGFSISVAQLDRGASRTVVAHHRRRDRLSDIPGTARTTRARLCRDKFGFLDGKESLSNQRIELSSSGSGNAVVLHLTFPDHMHRLNA